jgi:hypothetical protein
MSKRGAGTFLSTKKKNVDKLFANNPNPSTAV